MPTAWDMYYRCGHNEIPEPTNVSGFVNILGDMAFGVEQT